MMLEIVVGDNQSQVEIPEAWLTMLETLGKQAAAIILQRHCIGAAPLAGLECVEVALVDDETSARVHEQFMGIGGATDVITFDYGEIVIGAAVARRQAADYQQPLPGELLRYLIHGLLHLAGHEDAEPGRRAVMEAAQEELVAELWGRIV